MGWLLHWRVAYLLANSYCTIKNVFLFFLVGLKDYEGEGWDKCMTMEDYLL